MNSILKSSNQIPQELRERLDELSNELSQKLENRTRIMIVDLINRISRLDQHGGSEFKNLYSQMLVILNAALRAGHFFYDEI
jgi:hypothetical protein